MIQASPVNWGSYKDHWEKQYRLGWLEEKTQTYVREVSWRVKAYQEAEGDQRTNPSKEDSDINIGGHTNATQQRVWQAQHYQWGS